MSRSKGHVMTVEHDGRVVTLYQLSRLIDVPYVTLAWRYAQGARGAALTAPSTNRPSGQHERWTQEFRYQGLL